MCVHVIDVCACVRVVCMCVHVCLYVCVNLSAEHDIHWLTDLATTGGGAEAGVSHEPL